MQWLLEPDVFGVGAHPLTAAARAAGHRVRAWTDAWWSSSRPRLDGPVVFHGSLANAARIAADTEFDPGAWCNAAGFRVSAWAAAADRWLLHRRTCWTTVEALCADPIGVAGSLTDAQGRVFVRPDSALKPFSGRVVDLHGVTPADLDHGYYYDDLRLPIQVAPTQVLGREFRFVVARRAVVAGCAYVADGRQADAAAPDPEVTTLAEEIARAFAAPDPVYVLDLVQTDAGPRMLEINPFSGADLYGCDPEAVVTAAAAVVGAPG